jgi:hypothetical protein
MERKVHPNTCQKCRDILMDEDVCVFNETKNQVNLPKAWSSSRQAAQSAILAGCPMCRALRDWFATEFEADGNENDDPIELNMELHKIQGVILIIRPKGATEDRFLSFELLAEPCKLL